MRKTGGEDEEGVYLSQKARWVMVSRTGEDGRKEEALGFWRC